jgi:hypothetical protein
MKLNELKNIIREEIMAALAENAPATAPPKPGTKEKEKTPVKPTPKRRGFDKPEPGVQPKPKASLKEEEKELAKKIAQRFLKLKK